MKPKELDTFKSECVQLSDLLDLEVRELRVPTYQRPYEWTEKCVSDLLSDVHSTMQRKGEDQKLLLGSVLLLETVRGHKCDVVDGQQRFSTLVMLYSIIYRHLERHSQQLKTKSQEEHARELNGLQKVLGDLRKRFVAESGGTRLLCVSSAQGGDNELEASQTQQVWTNLTSFADSWAELSDANGNSKYAMRWRDMTAWVSRLFNSQKALERLLRHIDTKVYLTVTTVTNIRLALKSFVRCNAAGELQYCAVSRVLYSISGSRSPAIISGAYILCRCATGPLCNSQGTDCKREGLSRRRSHLRRVESMQKRFGQKDRQHEESQGKLFLGENCFKAGMALLMIITCLFHLLQSINCPCACY